ncbi:MAG: hypothetical protein HRU15_04925 [Planctomycetes bacterium]|nr:hypothetical protein [Planctomycetota bacterium]
MKVVIYLLLFLFLFSCEGRAAEEQKESEKEEGYLSRELTLEEQSELLENIWNPFANFLKPDDPSKIISRLTPAIGVFTVGQPMRFSLELINNGKNTISYVSGGSDCCYPLEIFNGRGEKVFYIGGYPQSYIGIEKLPAGRSCVIYEGLNVSEDYLISKGGIYTFKYNGERPSEVKVLVQNGEKYPTHKLVVRLKTILPDKWIFAYPNSYQGKMRLIDEIELAKISLHSPGDLIRDIVMIDIVQCSRPIEELKKQPFYESTYFESLEFLGRGESGYVYFKTDPRIDKMWPKVKEEIKKTLKVGSVKEVKPSDEIEILE